MPSDYLDIESVDEARRTASVLAARFPYVTPSGALYPFARLRTQTELAGACYSPDGAVMFVNVYSPGKTLAITGPWGAVTA